ncbi:hypothetical protein OTU49_011801, partial [Cherax quadricarinatus]
DTEADMSVSDWYFPVSHPGYSSHLEHSFIEQFACPSPPYTTGSYALPVQCSSNTSSKETNSWSTSEGRSSSDGRPSPSCSPSSSCESVEGSSSHGWNSNISGPSSWSWGA